MKISKRSTILELPHTLEKGTAQLSSTTPYFIERIEESDGSIVWYGVNLNWVFDTKENRWFVIGGDSGIIPCEEPEYERMYKEISLLKN